MKNSFLSIFGFGLLVAGLLSFTEPYHPEDPQQQDRKRNKGMKADTMSDTRLNRDNRPLAEPMDTLPTPRPKPPVPLPDTIHHMH